MKLIIQNARIAATATDDYTGPDVHIPAPEDFNLARLGEYVYENGELVLPAPPTPTSCTPAQGLIALYALKQLSEQDILDAIAQITDPVQRYTTTIGYQRATTWERGSATMQAMAQLLGLTEADLDRLFAYASGVVV